MRINKKEVTGKHLAIAGIVIALIVITASAAAYLAQKTIPTEDLSADDDQSLSVEPAPSTLSAEDAAAKQRFIEEQEDSSDSDSSNSGSSATNSVVVASEQSGATVTIVSKIYGIGNGTCTLRVTNSDKIFDQNADVIYQSAYSTCAGFSVPVETLDTGVWSISLLVTSSDGVTATSTSSLEVN